MIIIPFVFGGSIFHKITSTEIRFIVISTSKLVRASYGLFLRHTLNMQTAMVMWVIERLPEEEKYKKVEYYPADKFDAECGKHCKHL